MTATAATTAVAIGITATVTAAMATTAVATMETETDITEVVILEMAIAAEVPTDTNVIIAMTMVHPDGTIIAIPTAIQTAPTIRIPRATMINRGAITGTTILISRGVFIQKTATLSSSDFMTTEVDGCGALERFAIDIITNFDRAH
jgi:hypothetical protein